MKTKKMFSIITEKKANAYNNKFNNLIIFSSKTQQEVVISVIN